MSKIYTKKGDKGETGTFRGRVAKSDRLVEALGAMDELNSWIGLCRSENAKRKMQNAKPEIKIQKYLDAELRRIQENLMTIASGLAGSGLKIRYQEIKKLENRIDKMTEELPKLSNFIYPIGELQVARAVARRAEREVVKLDAKDKNILKYLNRLSDALFTIGRWVNFEHRVPEEVWKS